MLRDAVLLWGELGDNLRFFLYCCICYHVWAPFCRRIRQCLVSYSPCDMLKAALLLHIVGIAVGDDRSLEGRTEIHLPMAAARQVAFSIRKSRNLVLTQAGMNLSHDLIAGPFKGYAKVPRMSMPLGGFTAPL